MAELTLKLSLKFRGYLCTLLSYTISIVKKITPLLNGVAYRKMWVSSPQCPNLIKLLVNLSTIIPFPLWKNCLESVWLTEKYDKINSNAMNKVESISNTVKGIPFNIICVRNTLVWNYLIEKN